MPYMLHAPELLIVSKKFLEPSDSGSDDLPDIGGGG